MEKKSILKAFSPRVDQHGTHKTYTDKYGTKYTFDLVMDNGDMGESSSPNQTPTWKINTEYSYVLETGQYGNKIKSLKSTSFNKGQGGGVPNNQNNSQPFDAEKHKQREKLIALQACYESATSIICANYDKLAPNYTTEMFSDMIDNIAITYFAFVNEVDDTQNRIVRMSSLKRAVEQSINIPMFSLNTNTLIIDRARKIADFIMRYNG